MASTAMLSIRPPAPLSAEVATFGPLAQAVLHAASGVQRVLHGQYVDVAIADTPIDAAGVTQPTVVLSANPHLGVPAINPRTHNPIGWRRLVGDRVAALGPLEELPRGIAARYLVKSTDLDLIRRCHHLEDIRNFHPNATERAGTLVRLAAIGTPIHVADDDSQLKSLLGTEFYNLLRTDIAGADANTRELHSVRMRRIALRDHSLDKRVEQICGKVVDSPPTIPSVSILLATNRPAFIEQAIAQVRKQNYPRLELILALHGDGFDQSNVEDVVARLECTVESLRIDARQPFHFVLNTATAAANGELVTKMDDDDYYAADHIWDLVLAHQYSGAHLVGKGAEIVYLQRRNQTVERNRTGAERYSRNIAGGTLFMSREDLKAIGGWRGVPPHVDQTLIENVLHAGGLVYRTHGHGYVLIRHGDRHSWNAVDDYFLNRATVVHSGWRGFFAGIDDRHINP